MDYINIDKMYAGVGDESQNGRISLGTAALKGWGNNVTYHERLKSSYYVMQELWTEEE